MRATVFEGLIDLRGRRLLTAASTYPVVNYVSLLLIKANDAMHHVGCIKAITAWHHGVDRSDRALELASYPVGPR